MYANLLVEIEGREPINAHRVLFGRTGDLVVFPEVFEDDDEPTYPAPVVVTRGEHVSVEIRADF